jgi:hypothetical protein
VARGVTALSRSVRARPSVRRLALALATAVSAAVTMAIVGRIATSLAGNRMAPWIVGRAAGVTAYLLLMALVMLGLVLSHPWRVRITRPNSGTRIRLHICLAAFTFAFTALHILVLATDRYAGVGWSGALLPMGAEYRPVATTLGVVGFWSGLIAGVTAGLAGRLALGIWWPIHKVSGISLILVWLHGVFGGGDSSALVPMYLVTGAMVILLAVGRYSARTARDHRTALVP